MQAKIESYSYDEIALLALQRTGILRVQPDHFIELSWNQKRSLEKSLRVANRYLHIQQEACGGLTARPANEARWISVHLDGSSEETPILIRSIGGDSSRVMAGAGGQLNGLVVNNVKTPDEYSRLARPRAGAASRIKDRRGELYALLAQIQLRQKEAMATKRTIEKAINATFDENQANIEILRRKAQGGDNAAEAAYLALLRGRRTIA